MCSGKPTARLLLPVRRQMVSMNPMLPDLEKLEAR